MLEKENTFFRSDLAFIKKSKLFFSQILTFRKNLREVFGEYSKIKIN